MKKLIFLISISLCFALTNHYSLRLKEDQPWVEFTNHLIVSAQTPLQITSISDNRSTYQNSNIPLYEKLEISFQVNGSSATNLQWPYDPNPPAGITPGVGISVEAEFTHDNWRTIYKVPAFYYQEYQPPQKQPRLVLPQWQLFVESAFCPHLSWSMAIPPHCSRC